VQSIPRQAPASTLNRFRWLCRTRANGPTSARGRHAVLGHGPVTPVRCDNVSQPESGLSCARSMSMPFLNGGWRP